MTELHGEPITLATLDVIGYTCDALPALAGHPQVGDWVQCPNGDHEHLLIHALHTEVVDVTYIEVAD